MSLWLTATALAIANFHGAFSLGINAAMCNLCEEFQHHPKKIDSLPELLKSKNISTNVAMLQEINLQKLADHCYLYCTINITETPTNANLLRARQKRFLGYLTSRPAQAEGVSTIAFLLETFTECLVDKLLYLIEYFAGMEKNTIKRKECKLKEFSLIGLIKYILTHSAMVLTGGKLVSRIGPEDWVSLVD